MTWAVSPGWYDAAPLALTSLVIEDKWSAQPDFQVIPELPRVTSYTIKKQENISDEEVNFLISMPEHKVETRLDDGRIGVQVDVTATDVVAKKLNNEWKLDW